MKISVEVIEKARAIAFAITALSLFSYAALALVTGKPNPFYWWIPGALGLASVVAMVLISALAGRAVAGQAWDELYRETSRNAAAQSYWVSLALFALIGLLTALGVANPTVTGAVFGTLMGGSYLALFVWHDWRSGLGDE